MYFPSIPEPSTPPSPLHFFPAKPIPYPWYGGHTEFPHTSTNPTWYRNNTNSNPIHEVVAAV